MNRQESSTATHFAKYYPRIHLTISYVDIVYNLPLKSFYHSLPLGRWWVSSMVIARCHSVVHCTTNSLSLRFLHDRTIGQDRVTAHVWSYKREREDHFGIGLSWKLYFFLFIFPFLANLQNPLMCSRVFVLCACFAVGKNQNLLMTLTSSERIPQIIHVSA